MTGPAHPQRAEVPVYDFEDWPVHMARLTWIEAAELTDRLSRGAQGAYRAAGRGELGADEYSRRFGTAAEADRTAQETARESGEFHRRELDQPLAEWITSTQQEEECADEKRARPRESEPANRPGSRPRPTRCSLRPTIGPTWPGSHATSGRRSAGNGLRGS